MDSTLTGPVQHASMCVRGSSRGSSGLGGLGGGVGGTGGGMHGKEDCGMTHTEAIMVLHGAGCQPYTLSPLLASKYALLPRFSATAGSPVNCSRVGEGVV